MSDQLIKVALDKRAKEWAEAQDIRHRAERDGRDLTTEEDETFSRALDEVERLDKQVEQLERSNRLGKVEARTEAPAPGAGENDEDATYERAFSNMLRRGINDMQSEDRGMLQNAFVRAQAAGTDTAGGYTVPPGFLTRMTETMKAYGGLLGEVEVITTSTGNSLEWPSSDDTANIGAILAENTQVTEQDFVFGTKTLDAYTYTSKLVRVSLQLLQDSAFNLDAWLPVKLGERIGRAVAAHVATGTGTGQPEGVSGATTAVTGAAGAVSTITYDHLIDLEHSVDPAYRVNAKFALNDASVAMIRKLKDTQGRPLWVPSLAPGVPSTINGRPYAVDNGLPAPAASAKSVFFGDFRAFYVARQVSGAQVLRLAERYADFLQVGFLGFSRFDGARNDTGAVKAYAHPAA